MAERWYYDNRSFSLASGDRGEGSDGGGKPQPLQIDIQLHVKKIIIYFIVNS